MPNEYLEQLSGNPSEYSILALIDFIASDCNDCLEAAERNMQSLGKDLEKLQIIFSEATPEDPTAATAGYTITKPTARKVPLI